MGHIRATLNNIFQRLWEVADNRGQNFTKKAILENEDKIATIISRINEHSNPFSINHLSRKMLKNIIAGHLLKWKYVDHIFNAKAIGQAVVVEFIQVWLNERSVSFWNPVKKMNISTA